MRSFRVKNFERFQHYKDRSPPWIKLYNELLDDYEFGCLRDASKMHLVAIWLLASRSDNKLPYDPAWIAKRISATDKVDLDALARAGFIIADQSLHTAEQDAGTALADCLPRDRGETEGEGEGEGETETEQRRETLAGRDAPMAEISEAHVFRLGKAVLGKTAGGVIAKLKKHLNHDLKATHDLLQQAQAKENPMEWVQACMRSPDWREQPEYRGVI
jgi:hypothetical protein